MVWLDHNFTPIGRIKHCSLSNLLDSPGMGEKFPDGKGVLLPGREKWKNQLNRPDPAVAPTAHCRDNTKGPGSDLREMMAISSMLTFATNHQFAHVIRADTKKHAPAAQEGPEIVKFTVIGTHL